MGSYTRIPETRVPEDMAYGAAQTTVCPTCPGIVAHGHLAGKASGTNPLPEREERRVVPSATSSSDLCVRRASACADERTHTAG